MSIITGFEHFIRQDEPLAPLTWLRIGGPADFFAEPTTVDELVALVRRCREHDVAVRVLGGGSNLLVRDEGVRGVVIQLGAAAFGEIAVKGQAVTAGGGAKLGHLISASAREGLGGLEMLVGIPGTLGGALHNNAGNHGSDVGQFTYRATVLVGDGQVHERKREEMAFGYRQSSLDELVVLSAELRFEPDDPLQITKRMQKQWIIKKSHQPLAHESAACAFKNPGEMSASSLIEQAGLGDVRAGGVTLSPRHANFLVAERGATSADALRLIDEVREQVLDRTGVELKPAIEVW
ncbi:MAG: UDP-N-acetylmuramate dehydrogenase [Pirellulales bacterium]